MSNKRSDYRGSLMFAKLEHVESALTEATKLTWNAACSLAPGPQQEKSEPKHASSLRSIDDTWAKEIRYDLHALAKAERRGTVNVITSSKG